MRRRRKNDKKQNDKIVATKVAKTTLKEMFSRIISSHRRSDESAD